MWDADVPSGDGRHSRRTMLAGAGAIALAIAGGTFGPGRRARAEAVGGAPRRAARTTPPSTTGAELDPNAVVRFAYWTGLTSFDPHRASSSFSNTSLNLTYDRLVHLAPDASAAPGLATDWGFGDDGLTLDLTIRRGVSFHDGTPFDVEAVRANLERAQNLEGSVVVAELAAIEQIEVIDAEHVRLHLSEASAELPLVLSDRAGMMISPAAFENPDLDRMPVGCGMFRVTSYVENDRITYERADDYWDPDAVRCAGFEIQFLTDSTTRLNAIRSGEVDFTQLDPAQVADAESAGLSVIQDTTLAFYQMQLNRSFEPFSVLEVRQALNHAIDRSAVVESLPLGFGLPAGQVFPEGYVAFDEATGSDPYPFDPDRARQLLAGGGYPDGFTFELLVPTLPLLTTLGEAVQAQLDVVGVTAEIRSIEVADTAPAFMGRLEGNALITNWSGRADPTQTVKLLFGAGTFQNAGGHTTPAMTAAIAATQATFDPDDRVVALRAASAQAVSDALTVPICFPATSTVATASVVGLQNWRSGKPEFRGVAVRAD
ncbi:MAG: ABC transporter substrate-binding protein [Desertimonas sp.]